MKMKSYDKCKICSSSLNKIFESKVLHKYKVKYYQCPVCLFVQTEYEYWLKEAYESSMNKSDTGVISRNMLLGFKTSLLFTFLFDKNAEFIDFAGGWGFTTRLLRDIGFNTYWYDPFTRNELSRGFEADLRKKYEALTIFEGFEHFQNPHEDLKKIFNLSDTVIFSTTLVPKPTPKPKDWWYYGFKHGQHISLYSKETFEYIAQRYGCHYYTDGRYFHMFTKKKISKSLFLLLSSPVGFLLLPLVLLSNKSKTLIDHINLENGE